ncbi:sensor histidine kinase [Cyclobacterium qasimii]|nr:HAMP domain-containing sensor histidine kinase [Cyclobacterium qasimii]
MKKIFNSLFWRLSFFFLFFLLIISGVFIYITHNSSIIYSQETSQKLNRPLAERVAKFTQPFVNGSLNDVDVEEMFHNVMVLNPSVEVYLLDESGKILSYYAPFGEVKLERLNLDPIHQFIDNKEEFIKGEDPRNPGVHKIFSAASIINNDKKVGYIYIILASEEYTSVTDMLAHNYQIKLATKAVLITLLAAIIIGFFVIWYLTKNVNKISAAVNRFKHGDLSSRIHLKSKGELSVLANNIDSMADTIVSNINEIRSVEKLRKELISNISHDLRTPLTSIQGYAETLVLLEEKLDKKTKIKYLDTILSSTQRLKKMVDDLFEISKLEASQVETKKENFSINELLSDMVMKFNLIAKSKSIDFKIQMLEENVLVFADIALMERVFQNLLDNALKHTNEGGTVLIVIKNKTTDAIEIMIKDTGIGISSEELPYIFDRYKKGESNNQDGTGLGLAIVKKYWICINKTSR